MQHRGMLRSGRQGLSQTRREARAGKERKGQQCQESRLCFHSARNDTTPAFISGRESRNEVEIDGRRAGVTAHNTTA